MTLKDKLHGWKGFAAATSLGLAALVGGIEGCVSNHNSGVGYGNYSATEKEEYSFVRELAENRPKDLVKSRSGVGGVIYHDKNLKVSNDLMVAGWPKSGKGRYVVVNSDGISAGYWDNEEIKRFSQEKDLQALKKGLGFSYNSKDGKEEIIFYNKGRIEGYSRENNSWFKISYDLSEKGELNESGKKKVEEKEVTPYLLLIKEIRENYPID